MPARYDADQVKTKINAVQKEIGQLKKVFGHISPSISLTLTLATLNRQKEMHPNNLSKKPSWRKRDTVWKKLQSRRRSNAIRNSRQSETMWMILFQSVITK